MHKQHLTNKAIFWKFLKTAGISGALFIGGMLIILITLALVFQGRIQEIFLDNINRNLRTEIQVENIRLNLIRNFPNASLTFSNTRVFEPGSADQRDTLLEAQRLYLKFSLWDILRKNYTIKQVEISKARLSPVVYADGSNNYQIWDSGTSDSDSEFSISLNRIIFNEVFVDFEDMQTNTHISFNTEKVIMSGHFQDETFDLTAIGNFFANDITLDNVSFIKNKPIEVDLSLLVVKQSEFIFQKGLIKLNNNPFSILGSINTSGQGVHFDTKISGMDLSIQGLINDLPSQWKSYAQGYQGKGNLVFNASLNGIYSASSNPYIEASYNITQAELFHRPTGLSLTGLTFSGIFNNGKQQNLNTSTIAFTDFYTNINKGFIEGDFSMYNFHKPDLNLNILSDTDVGDLAKLLRMQQVASASGNIQTNLAFRGRMSQSSGFTAHDIGNARATGYIYINNTAFRIKDNPLDYNEFNGSFLFSNTNLIVEEFSGNAGSSDFKLKGTFRNVLPYLFLENEKLFIDASLYSHNLNFDEMLQQGAQETDTTYQLRFSDRLGFNLEASVVNLKFRKFEAQHVMGNASLQSKRFYASNLAFRSMNGKVTANGFIDGTNEEFLTLGCQAQLQKVDINQLFFQMGNFGQTGIVAENIFGDITSDFTFTARWSPTLEVDWSSLETTANIKVENGALVNYQPMVELSRFLRIGDLNHVKFSTLENQIKIKDYMIIIPEMEINSSALNLVITGEHTFEHDINYRLQVLLSDLLARENRASRNPQEQYGDIIDDGLGRTTLFLAITGTIDEPVFKYDYRGVREKLQADFRNEKQTLREVLRSEFGGSSKEQQDTTKTPSAARQERERIKKQEEGEFVIEWED